MSLKEVCRACLSTGRAMCSIMESIVPTFDSPPNSIVEQWQLFTKMLIANDDSFPDKICIRCLIEIQQMYSFIVKCERSENMLKKIKNVKLCLKKLKTTWAIAEVDRSENDMYPNIEQIGTEWDGRRNGCDEECSARVREIKANTDDQVDLRVQSQRKLIVQYKDDNSEAELLHAVDCENDVRKNEVLIIQDIKNEPELDICTEKDEIGGSEIVSLDVSDYIESKDESSIVIFKCPGCHYECMMIELLEKHVIEDHMEGQMCRLCNQEFECRAMEHCSTHLYLKSTKGVQKSTNVERYKCKMCSKMFARKHNFNKHLAYHSEERLFKCKICSTILKNKQRFTEHLRWHTGETPFICEICQKVFRNNNTLRDHLRRHDEGSFKCEICSNVLKNKFRFMEHIRCHKEVKPFKCLICPDTFKLKISLTQHLYLCHTGERPFKCDICSKTLKNKYRFMEHVRCHTGERPFKCKICHKAFQNNYRLKEHFKCHTNERPYKCDLCTETFVRKSDLNSHRLYMCTRQPGCHTRERPFKCEACQEAFVNKYRLREHLKIHTGERPFKCEVCPKTFVRKSDLNSHICLYARNHKSI